MRRLLDYLIVRKKTLKELSVYAFQTYGVTLVSFVGAIITVRVLDRYEYGTYGIVFSIVGIVYTLLNAGIVRQVGNRILSSPLDDSERLLYMAYTKKGFFYTTLLGFILLPFFFFFYDPKTVIYIAVAFFVQHLTSFIALLFHSEIRERKLRTYYLFESLLEYSRVIMPIVGVLIFQNLAGYFAGSAFTVVVAMVLVFSFKHWRYKALHYLRTVWSATVSLKEITHLIRLGLSMSIESGAATLYLSIFILMGASYLGVSQAAVLKVLAGYYAALGMSLLPLSRWVNFHLPKRIATSTHPFRELLGLAGVTTAFIIVVYLAGVLVGPWLLPLVYGQRYVDAVPFIPWAGGWLVFSTMAIGLSAISRQYKLSFWNGVISLTNVALGLIFIFSPFGPRSILSFSIFYSLWIIPALIASYVLVYIRLQKKVDNA
ncbi:MAG: hypothetical protein PHC53_00670 [Patescibacteria group bacterium]|nr:hypothetical protein [Patescibacteria group bacterium]